MRSDRKLSDLLANPRLVPHRFIAGQLRRPSGRFGRWVTTRFLNKGNEELLVSVVDALELRGDEAFLDLGFGGGLALELAAARTRGPLFGVDFSPDAVEAAQRRLVSLVREGRLNLITADVVDLPLRDGLVDACCTANTIYFWPDPATALRSLHRVVAPGGKLAIGFAGASKMREFGHITSHGFSLFEPEEVAALLEDASFVDVRVEALHGRNTEGDHIALARVAG